MGEKPIWSQPRKKMSSHMKISQHVLYSLSRSVEVMDIIYLSFCASEAVESDVLVPAAGGQSTWNTLYI